VLRCAALADPHSQAWRLGSSADTAAARAARDRCYSHLLGVLKPLLGVGPPPVAAPMGAAAAAAGTEGAGAGAEAEGSPLTPKERLAAKEAMMQVGSLKLAITGSAGRWSSAVVGHKVWCQTSQTFIPH
jgi:hypothetical protein